MDNRKRILDIIQVNLPDEYNIIGEETTLDIIDHNLSKPQENLIIHNSSYGRNMDFITIITFVAGAVQIIDFVLNRAEKIKLNKETKEGQDIIEVKDYISQHVQELKKDDNEYDELIRKLLDESK